MSPPKHSLPIAHWAAILQQARIELELLSGEVSKHPIAQCKSDSSSLISSQLTPRGKQTFTLPDETPWSVVVKKKGKKSKRKDKKKDTKKIGKRPAPDKVSEHPVVKWES